MTFNVECNECGSSEYVVLDKVIVFPKEKDMLIKHIYRLFCTHCWNDYDHIIYTNF